MRLKGFLIAAAIACAGFVSSCETMSAEECAAADWRALGFNDAAGNGSDNFRSRAESCGEKGFVADGAAYAAGFGEGMYQFCQPAYAFQYALRGGSFNGVCPAELQRDFYGAYTDGGRIHAAQAELNDARSRLSSLQSRDNEIDDDIRRHQDALRNAPSDDEAARLRHEIDDLHKRRADVREERRDLEPRLYYLQRRVDDLHIEIGSRWSQW